MPLDGWLDAVHASLVTAPHDVLKHLNDQLVVQAAMADPKGARETWGMLPEHQVTPSAEQRFGGVEQR